LLSSWSIAEGLSALSAGAATAVVLAWFVWTLVELRRSEQARALVLLSAGLAAGLVLAAVLRPTRVTTRGSRIGPRVVVLLDQSRRLRLPGDAGERRVAGAEVVRRLAERWKSARVTFLGFADGKLEPLTPADDKSVRRQLGEESDLLGGMAELAAEQGERPRSVVIVSDGRLQRPAERVDDAALGRALGALGAPVHTVRLTENSPADASVRDVSAAGAAVAHQPLALKVTVGCAGGLACDALPVTVRELRQGAAAAELARGVVKPGAGEATVDLEVTIERAGRRVIEIALAAPEGDKVPANDKRYITLDVARERVRLLHVAGRPTYDVRQLRMWLKADESIDLVGFFILRTNSDNPNVVDESAELSLIPFPVEALFTQHLPSFDAVMLQDIDAYEYKLDPYLPALAAYVRGGGGLIMVGGPSAFAGGGYAGSPLELVLPTTLSRRGEPYDLRSFVPRYTPAGRAAPTLQGVIELLGDALPRMEGSNTLGPARPGSIVLWEHPDRRAEGLPMPVLALAEVDDGRSIALGVDATHELGFGELAERAGGRAYGALWDGLLGWLMRDPRYEVGHVALAGACIAGEPVKLSLVPPPGSNEDLELEIERLGQNSERPLTRKVPRSGAITTAEIGPFNAGGYSARMKVGAAPPTRFDFACEDGGLAFRDSRPDPARLERIARVTGGSSVRAADAADLPLPKPTDVTLERRTAPLLPAWVWTLAAAAALGAHWVVRRQRGLA
jgi:uncharacterized membrane protein